MSTITQASAHNIDHKELTYSCVELEQDLYDRSLSARILYCRKQLSLCFARQQETNHSLRPVLDGGRCSAKIWPSSDRLADQLAL